MFILDRRITTLDFQSPLRFDGHSSVALKARTIQSSTKSLNPAADIRPQLIAQRISILDRRFTIVDVPQSGMFSEAEATFLKSDY